MRTTKRVDCRGVGASMHQVAGRSARDMNSLPPATKRATMKMGRWPSDSQCYDGAAAGVPKVRPVTIDPFRATEDLWITVWKINNNKCSRYWQHKALNAAVWRGRSTASPPIRIGTLSCAESC